MLDDSTKDFNWTTLKTIMKILLIFFIKMILLNKALQNKKLLQHNLLNDYGKIVYIFVNVLIGYD